MIPEEPSRIRRLLISRHPQLSSITPGLTKEELQTTFTSAITSAAFSLSSTGKLDYAWTSFEGALKDGRLFRSRKK
jgi:hypothetical protein